MKFKLLLFILLGLSGMQIQSQTISLDINKWDGSNKNIAINTLRKISFSGSNMILNYQTGSSESIITTDIRKLSFSSFTGVDDILVADNKLCIFPNPCTDFISLKNLTESELNISIYSISGIELLHSKLANVNQQIDIRQLNKGIYLVKVNSNILKFIKL